MNQLKPCLGCGRLFTAASKFNRFCKNCKKKQRKYNGAFEDLDTSQMSHAVSRKVQDEYYSKRRTSFTVSRLEESIKEASRKLAVPKKTAFFTSNLQDVLGPPFPVGL